MAERAKTDIPPPGSVVLDDVERFNAQAEAWWDPHGPFAPLHNLNPVRLAYIRDRLAGHFGRPPEGPSPLAGLRLLDIGCGGGLLCEPLCALGAELTGIDAGEKNIRIAEQHARKGGLSIAYRVATAEALASEKAQFDAVLAMEVIEHVAEPGAFLASCGALVKPGGLLFLATLNRTLKAYMLAIVGAEYVLGWLPRGTHQWDKFLKPSEIAAFLLPHGLTPDDIRGVTYNPLSGHWALSRDVAVNYMMCAVKGRAKGRAP